MTPLALVTGQLAEVRQRLATMKRPGTVAAVDAEAKRVRLRLGGSDDEPFLSPWVPYAQIAGDLKVHAVPSVGQQMMLHAPSGDMRQGVAEPFTWSDDQPSPSDDPDEVRLEFGIVQLRLHKTEGLAIRMGEMLFVMDDEHIALRATEADRFLIVHNLVDPDLVVHSVASVYADIFPDDEDLLAEGEG